MSVVVRLAQNRARSRQGSVTINRRPDADELPSWLGNYLTESRTLSRRSKALLVLWEEARPEAKTGRVLLRLGQQDGIPEPGWDAQSSVL